MPAPPIAYFPSLDKLVASVVDAAKSTLGVTDDGIGSGSSANSCLRTFARRLKLCWKYS